MEEVIKKLNEHDGEFKKVNKTLAEHTDQIDFIARTVADHTERLDRIEDRLEVIETKMDGVIKVVNVLDGVVGLLKKHDEEIAAINHNHKKLDHRVELLEQKV